MWSDSENEGLLPLLHCHEGVLASSMYLVYLSFKVSMYQCQRNLSYNPYLHTSSTMELMCLEMFFNNNTNSKKLKLKILFIEYFLHTYCCVKHVTWIVSLNLYNNPMRQLLLLSLFYDEEMEAPSNLPKFTKLWGGWDKFSTVCLRPYMPIISSCWLMDLQCQRGCVQWYCVQLTQRRTRLVGSS